MSRAALANPGLRGFDCNIPVSKLDARRFRLAGFTFAVRYVPRITRHTNDLTPNELTNLYMAGLGCMAVQHVESESSWLPSTEKGREYGRVAAEEAKSIGLQLGSSVWLDLEGVSRASDQEIIIRYCNYWYDQVHNAGFLPGIYIGWHSGLTPEQLYKRLRFTRYWSAYNLNVDQYPMKRGVCMRQAAGTSPAEVKFQIDHDVIVGDHLGGLPVISVPDEWDPR